MHANITHTHTHTHLEVILHMTYLGSKNLKYIITLMYSSYNVVNEHRSSAVPYSIIHHPSVQFLPLFSNRSSHDIDDIGLSLYLLSLHRSPSLSGKDPSQAAFQKCHVKDSFKQGCGVQGPVNFIKDRVGRSQNFQGCLCVLCVLEAPTILCARARQVLYSAAHLHTLCSITCFPNAMKGSRLASEGPVLPA